MQEDSDACEADAAKAGGAQTKKNVKGKKATNKAPAGTSDEPKKTPKGKKRQKSCEDTAVVPPDEPEGTPAGKAHSTRSRASFKNKHVLHVAEEAASPHPDANANADREAAEEAPSQPSKGRKRAKTIPQPAAKAAKTTENVATKRSTNAKDTVPNTPRQRAKMLSEVQASAADEDAAKPAPKSTAAKGSKGSKGGAASKPGAKSLAQLADSLAGGTSTEDVGQVSKVLLSSFSRCTSDHAHDASSGVPVRIVPAIHRTRSIGCYACLLLFTGCQRRSMHSRAIPGVSLCLSASFANQSHSDCAYPSGHPK